MSSLFPELPVAGLDYRAGLIGDDEERELIGRLEAEDLSPFRFHGWLGNRKTRSFGWRYDFDDASFTRAEAVPAWLDSLRASAAEFASVAPEDFVHVLLARYDPGAGIGWHKDRSVFGDVVGISLRSPCTFRMRRRLGHRFERKSLNAEPRSVYLLRGLSRTEWQHSVPGVEALRYSITFRNVLEGSAS